MIPLIRLDLNKLAPQSEVTGLENQVKKTKEELKKYMGKPGNSEKYNIVVTYTKCLKIPGLVYIYLIVCQNLW